MANKEMRWRSAKEEWPKKEMTMAFNETVMFWKPESGDDLTLEPCPFCGGHNVVYEKYRHDAGERWRVVCLGCCASVDPGYAQQRHIVQKLWNRRANPIRHGQWKRVGQVCVDGEYEDYYRCSQCSISYYRKSRYCPNCGSKMDKEKE